MFEGRCLDPGPWGAVCTQDALHWYSHYDASKDVSWQNDWREDTSPEGGGTYVDDEED